MMHGQIINYGMGAPPKRRPRPSSARAQAASGLTRARLVVAEDEYFVGVTIEQALREAGHEVLAVVATGEEAVRESLRLRPDLVLLDIRLAGRMNGIEAALELRAQGLTCLFASAHSDASTRAAGDRAEPAGWLTKPFSDGELLSSVAAALGRLRGH